MASDDGVAYNSDLERQLFESLTTGEGTYTYNQKTRSRPRSSVRFGELPISERPRKKKLVRDSQKAREFVGRPGSKRHNRYMNKMELLDKALSDSESELEIEIEFKIEYKSPFAILFEDADMKERWEPFIEVTEQEQTDLLAQLFPSIPRRQGKGVEAATAPHERFSALRREERKILKKHTGHPAIERFEGVIIDFLLSRRTTSTVKLTHRECLLFGLASVYYSVPLGVEELGDGCAGLTLRKTTKGVQLPDLKLSEYLKTLQQQQAF